MQTVAGRPRRVQARERARKLAALGLGPRSDGAAVVPPAAGHDDDVRSLLDGQAAVRPDAEAVGRDDLVPAVEREQLDLEVGAAARRDPEHLEGPDRVELLEALEEEDSDAHVVPETP